MINFTRAFDLAWERMMVILFRPFDLGKWFTIGFSAFLAGLLAGGNGFSGSYNRHTFDKSNWSASYSTNFNHLNSNLSTAFTQIQAGLTIFLVTVIGALVLGLVVLIYWLGSRGQFLFLDNVTRNRGAIAWPWSAYARLGNSLFAFYLLYLLIMLVVFVPFTIAAVFAGMPLYRQHRWPEGGEIPVFVLLGLVYLVIIIAFSVTLFLFRELGIPLMFRNGLMARSAFSETWRLMRLHPGAIFLFVLLRIALFIALVIVSIITCCLSCCIGALPYLGTVLLLPAIIYIKCFSLNFLAQFGPEYDVWTVDVSPPETPTPIA